MSQKRATKERRRSKRRQPELSKLEEQVHRVANRAYDDLALGKITEAQARQRVANAVARTGLKRRFDAAKRGKR